MKNFAVLLFLCLFVITSFAQKKNGTVYSEHETIDQTKALWEAVKNGDKEKVKTFFADSITVVRNGNDWQTTAENFGNNSGWWKANFVNLKVEDAPGAYADAIEYGDGNIWVQDWLMLTGINEETGINLDLHIHNLYAFNEEGKIGLIIQYFNNNVFEDIRDAKTTRENGKVYINHPYIATVRKLVNAYAAEDLEKMKSFYDESAQFSALDHGWDESIDLVTRMGYVKDNFANAKDIHFKQIGYPDCIFYELNNGFVVYSWWEYSFTREESGEKVVMPLMLSHSFNDDGKIVQEMAYYSTNHFE
ncbi:nuclear transport factor 2 family protein [Maribellus mangrovi]|uniref:nuclear transport factor 2 family protein n=1 Tax=Maribellus mangrovi TaxID=3133146 RepID=UPI0030EB192F